VTLDKSLIARLIPAQNPQHDRYDATGQPRRNGNSGRMLKTLNELCRARASRLSAVEGQIPGVVWLIIVIGGTLTTGYTYLFGFHDLRMHLQMTGSVATSLALIVVLMVALDWPFRGKVSIFPDALSRSSNRGMTSRLKKTNEPRQTQSSLLNLESAD
jgi:hypothetical protein